MRNNMPMFGQSLLTVGLPSKAMFTRARICHHGKETVSRHSLTQKKKQEKEREKKEKKQPALHNLSF